MNDVAVTTPIEIRSLKTLDELEKVQELDRLIWGMNESVPTHQTLTAVKNGGMVIGAYSGDRLIGFQYSFAGFNGEEVYLCSHMLGIHPDYRHLGIGERLKKAQRMEAIKLGYRQITWTYDPLESVNAYLNIGKLGAIVSTYIPNAYGEMNDPLNYGLASDRFLAEWWIQDQSFASTEEKKMDQVGDFKANLVIDWQYNANGIPLPLDVDRSFDMDKSIVFVPIPDQFQEMKKKDQQIAIEWRMKTRDAFMHYFSKGWIVSGFIKNNEEQMGKEKGIHLYVLTRKGDMK